ncbi:MAG: cyanophycin synthetase, partial [Bdellovibrionota bacterium]
MSEALVHDRAFDLEAELTRIKAIVKETTLGPTGRTLVDAAEARAIPWRRIGEGSLLQFGFGKNRRRVQTAVSDSTSLIAADLVQDKQLTKEVLRDASVPVANGFVARNEREIREGLSNLRPPFVVKPVDGNHGNGVTLGLNSMDEVLRACEEAWTYSSRAIVEEQVKGHDFRILVIGGTFTAACLRTPAHVIGDGEHQIEQLVEIANRDSRRGDGHSNVMTRLELDASALACLAVQGFGAKSVLAVDQRAFLRKTANLSTGGSAKDVTDETHISIRDLSERVSRIVGLDICGIDLIHGDITKPVDSSTSVIEVNAGPGLRMHVSPSEGRARDVGGAIVDMLYPNGQSSRIPIVSITGTNGKTTIARLVAHIASLGSKVGLTTSSGIYVDSVCVERGDTTGPRSARLVLDDPGVEFAVLETARGGLMRSGLGYDWSDVCVLSNIRPDHFGQDGIETLEDLVKVKALVVDRVRDGGIVVLNADDEQSRNVFETAFLDRRGKKIVYFSLDCEHQLLRESVRNAGFAFCVRNGWIMELSETDLHPVIAVSELAFAFRGTARFHLSNTLAAVAAARGSGFARDQVTAGLRSFRSNLHNFGRSNLYKVGQGYLMLDYGHNPDAIRAIGEMVSSWKMSSVTAVIGLPGDRSDELLSESARAMADGFDR